MIEADWGECFSVWLRLGSLDQVSRVRTRELDRPLATQAQKYQYRLCHHRPSHQLLDGHFGAKLSPHISLVPTTISVDVDEPLAF